MFAFRSGVLDINTYPLRHTLYNIGINGCRARWRWLGTGGHCVTGVGHQWPLRHTLYSIGLNGCRARWRRLGTGGHSPGR